MIVSKIYLDIKDNKSKIVFDINKDVKSVYCLPAGNFQDKITGDGFSYRSTVIGFDNIAISEEAKEALYKSLTNNLKKSRLEEYGRVVVYSKELNIPNTEKNQIGISWRPFNPKETANLELDVDSDFPIEVVNGFSPELLMKINHVLDNEFLKRVDYQTLNQLTPMM